MRYEEFSDMSDCIVSKDYKRKPGYGISIGRQLLDIDSEDSGRPRKEVLILGAGMAGLSAGYELAKRGHKVSILEAETCSEAFPKGRVGGRVWTHRFNEKRYGELGAMRIPGSHDYTHHYIKEMKLKRRKFINTDDRKDTYRNFEGVTCKTKVAVEEIGDLFNLSDPECEAISTKDDLEQNFLDILAGLVSGLEESEKYQLFGHGLLSERLKRWDKTSLLDILKDRATSDAVQLMGKASVLEDYWDCSTLFFLREEVDEAFLSLYEIVDGMGKLPEAMADKPLPNGETLRDLIEFGHEVRAISEDKEGIVVTVKHGDTVKEIKSPYVLCTIPFSVLRRINLQNLPISQTIKKAIKEMNYQSSTKVLINCDRRFWESEDDIYGGKSLTDAEIKQTYYPSDNCGQDDNVSEGPGVLLGSYTWGKTALDMGELKPKERGQLVVDQIECFHPQIKEHLNSEEPYASMAWDQYPYTAGAFSSSLPCELQAFFPEVGQPDGKIFFAGEHLSPYPTWVQGALWSGLQAVKQIVMT